MTPEQILQWKEKGFVLVENIFDQNLLKKIHAYLHNIYNKNELNVNDFGSNGKLDFPSNTLLDTITLDETLIKNVQTLLDTEDILLVQADTWGKKGHENFETNSNQNQRMHMDYGNNMFVHPSDWENPEAVAMIIYFSNTEKTNGGTACVPRENSQDELYQTPYINMPGIHSFPFINDKNTSENFFQKEHPDIFTFRQKLYQRETITNAKMGDVLFYRLDLWHRGTPVKKNEIRFVMNLLWKKKECYWIQQWNPGWTKKMYYGHVEKLITNLSPVQRSVLGIPKPGDAYWTLQKIKQLQVRYPSMDVEPYISKSSSIMATSKSSVSDDTFLSRANVNPSSSK